MNIRLNFSKYTDYSNLKDFYAMDFSNLDLTECIFKDCDLKYSEYLHTILDDVNFYGSNLTHCLFCHSFIRTASFIKADLSYSRFYNCTLNCSYFNFAKLTQAQFINCRLALVDFSNTIDLDTVTFENNIYI